MQVESTKIKRALLLTLLFSSFTNFAYAETPPDPPRAGGPLPGLSASELIYFNLGKDTFLELQSVQGTEPGAEDAGLGPRFNLNSCAGCHAQPATGGTSPAVNPEIAVATRLGATNTIPFFVRLNGPVREARFIFQLGRNGRPNGIRDGGVHNLFTITGRSDAPGCNIAQPDFEAQRRNNNIVFRIPTPLFGTGLMEAIPDNTILANMNQNIALKRSLGVFGHANQDIAGNPNRSGNDGTVTRFGWKAQNKSLEMFSGEAYNVEQGVTNDLFQNERDETESCLFNPLPESHPDLDAPNAVDAAGDVALFAEFMRFLAPPQPKPFTPRAQRGSELFVSVGCSLCHTPSMRTGNSSTAAISNKPANLYSDLLLHSMGPDLADNIIQGLAGVDDFRTAPLWGVSQRLFFLHDGRTSDLREAIQAHASTSNDRDCRNGNRRRGSDGIACQSEANGVIRNFNRLSNNEQGAIIEFLQSL